MAIFQAKYSDVCDACDEMIRPGEHVKYVGDELVHASCARSSEKSAPRVAQVCTKCFIEKPCGCEDGQ